MSEIDPNAVPGDAPVVAPDPVAAPDVVTQADATATQQAASEAQAALLNELVATTPADDPNAPVVGVTDPVPADAPVAPVDAPDPAIEAVASGDIEVSLIAYRGGTRDGQSGVVSGHDIVSVETESGETYTRTDEQQGDFRVYRFSVPEGEPVGGVSVLTAPDHENRLQADMAILQADVAKLVAALTPDDTEPAAA